MTKKIPPVFTHSIPIIHPKLKTTSRKAGSTTEGTVRGEVVKQSVISMELPAKLLAW